MGFLICGLNEPVVKLENIKIYHRYIVLRPNHSLLMLVIVHHR